MVTPARVLRVGVAVCLLAGLLVASVQPALATNATNLLGFSSASTAMGGSGSVGLFDISILNTNPATLSLMPNSEDRDPDSAISAGFAGVTVGVLQPYLHHTDAFGNDREGENNPFIGAHLGTAMRFRGLPQLTFGLGLFSQSGLGSEFRGLRTAFGTRDEVQSYERFVKLQSSISWEVTDGFSLAAGPYLGYADLTLHMFPRTGAAPVFAGLAIGDHCARNYGLGAPGSDCPWTVVVGAKVAAAWRITPIFTVGVAYTSPGSFSFDHGTANVTFTPAGRASRVGYDVSVSGITHPQNVQMGFALQPTKRLLLTTDLTWHDWSVFRGFTIKLRHPDTPGAPSKIDLFTREDWRDQFVVAVGAAYQLIPDTLTIRGGYNYANNPSPAATFTPAIQVPFEHHVTAGAGYQFNRRWSVDLGGIYAFEKKVTYTNNQFPFGPNATEKPSGFSVDVTLGYRF